MAPPAGRDPRPGVRGERPPTPRARGRAGATPAGPPAHAPAHAGRLALAVALAWALIFLPQLVAGRGFLYGDASNLRAFAEFSAARWHERHERTQWNPYIFAGIPSAVSLQDSRPQWLPDPLLDAFDALHRLPGFPPLAIPLAAHFAGMLAMGFLARGLWGARTVSAVWAALAWGLLPNLLVPFAFGHDAQIMACAFMPVVLLGIHRAAAAEGIAERLATAAILALAVACLLLAAHPQAAAFAATAAGVFAVERTASRGRWSSLAWIGGGALSGAAMSAAVWWPALQYNALSIRGATGGGISLLEVAQWSASLQDLVSIGWPWAAGFGGSTYWGGLKGNDFPQYAGAGVLALAALGVVLRRGRDGGAAAMLAALAVLGALLALGVRLGPLLGLLNRLLPFGSSFRVAVNALILTQLALVLLSTRGLERILDAGAIRARPLVTAAIAIVAAGALGAAALWTGPLRDAFAWSIEASRPAMGPALVQAAAHRAALDLGLRALVPAALLLGAALAARGGRAARGAPFALVAILALDLAPIGVPFLVRATGRYEDLEHPAVPAVARLAAAEPRCRVIAARRGLFFSNDWIRWRARSISGFHPAVPRGWSELMQAGLPRSPSLMRALSVGYVSGEGVKPDTSLLEEAAREPDGTPVWRLRGALPRAYAVPEVGVLGTDQAVLAALASPGFDPTRQAMSTDAGAAGRYPGSAACRIRWLVDEPDRLVLESAAPAAAFIVIADAWFPGWSARVDGRARTLHRVDHMLRGIEVSSGAHRVEMAFVPRGWRAGVACSRIAWAVWLIGGTVAMAAAGRRGRRAGPAAVHGS
jgi:hypothetical protein